VSTTKHACLSGTNRLTGRQAEVIHQYVTDNCQSENYQKCNKRAALDTVLYQLLTSIADENGIPRYALLSGTNKVSLLRINLLVEFLELTMLGCEYDNLNTKRVLKAALKRLKVSSEHHPSRQSNIDQYLHG